MKKHLTISGILAASGSLLLVANFAFIASPLIEAGFVTLAVGITVLAMTLSFGACLTLVGGMLHSAKVSLVPRRQDALESEDALFYCLHHVALARVS
ncbi:MAG: hypothetical protein SFY92_05055 [Verrucomicrobiae bacterium]|nr:hypothetical protein [Verrucomicrobiae bacterium]